MGQVVAGELAHIPLDKGVARRIREVIAIHFALGGVDVVRPFDLEAGFFEPKACEAYSGKEFEGLWARLAVSRVRAIVVHSPTLPRA